MKKIAALVLMSSLAAHANGVDFQPAPISFNNECSSLVLKGTTRFAGTAFIVPSVLVSINKNGEQLFEVLKVKENEYLLRMAIYLPSDLDAALAYRPNQSRLYAHACKLSQIQAELSRSPDRDLPKDTSFHISPLPIKKLKVWLEGIDEPAVLGVTDPDLKETSGIDQIVEFKIHGKDQYNLLLTRLSDKIGLQLTLDMQFEARSSKGFYSAIVSSDKVAESIQSKFTGDIQVTHADLAANISQTLSALNLDIYQEGDVGDVYQQMAQDLINQLGKDVMETTDAKPLDPADAGDAKYKVQAVADYVRNKKSFKLQFEKMGDPETKIYETSAIVTADLNEANASTRWISSDQDWTPLFPGAVSRNESVSISVGSKVVKNLNFTTSKSMYGKSEIEGNSALAAIFPTVLEVQTDLENISTEGKYTVAPFARYFTPTIYSEKTAKTEFTWGYSQLNPNYLAQSEEDVELDARNLGSYPVEFKFSNLGDRSYKLDELVTKNPAFKGVYDPTGGEIILAPSADLGVIMVKNKEVISSESHVTKKYFQKKAYVNCLVGNCSEVTRVDGPAQGFKSYLTTYSVSVKHPQVFTLGNPKLRDSSNSLMMIP